MYACTCYICWRAAQHHVSPAILQLCPPPLSVRPSVALHNDSEGHDVLQRLNLEHSPGSWHSHTLNFSCMFFTVLCFAAVLVELLIWEVNAQHPVSGLT